MPLIVEGRRVPTRWAEAQAERVKSRATAPLAGRAIGPGNLRLALINNMPDPALEDTEMQFFELLDGASGDLPVNVELYSLAGLARGERAQQHLNSFYCDFNDLWKSRFDGVIITGTEPREPNLRDEPYWGLLTQVFDWVEENTTSAVLSCLAAHASVLHGDAVSRHRLPDKQFGVFESSRTCDHALLSGGANAVRFPHSRWNEVREGELIAAGYTVVTKSADAGVDLFVKKKKKSLFVHFQGHPEYTAPTLFKEYRRDIKRFLRHERETYPTMPAGYFDGAAAQHMNKFRENASADRREEIMASFPESVADGLQSSWHASAMSVYRNWLRYMESRKKESAPFAAVARIAQSRVALADGEIA
jgi:homoserine O-succinyltransferase/O-acetyltransferase